MAAQHSEFDKKVQKVIAEGNYCETDLTGPTMTTTDKLADVKGLKPVAAKATKEFIAEMDKVIPEITEAVNKRRAKSQKSRQRVIR